MSPGRKPSRSPASTAGRVRMMRPTSRLDSAATASAIARYVLPVPAGPIANVTVWFRMASTYRFCVTVFGEIFLPRWRQTTSSKTSRMSSAWSIAASTASTVLGPISCPPSTSSASSSTTARACATLGSSPSMVRRLPRRRRVIRRRSRSASRTPSPTVASSAATSLETERTSCTWAQCRPSRCGRGACAGVTLSSRNRHRHAPSTPIGSQWGGGRARLERGAGRSGELLAHELAHGRAVRAPGDLRHHVRHHPADVAHAGRTHLGDCVVDDLLELFLGQRRGHELLEHRELALLAFGPLVAAGLAERLRGLGSALPLPLQHLELLVVVQRPQQLLLRRAQACQDQPQRVAPLRVACRHRLLELVLQTRDQRHPAIPQTRPPRRCQCRWNTVCPAPSPTFTSTR